MIVTIFSEDSGLNFALFSPEISTCSTFSITSNVSVRSLHRFILSQTDDGSGGAQNVLSSEVQPRRG
jgi:hypothetical protein